MSDAPTHRMTTKQQRLILEFLNGAEWAYGRDIMRGTGLGSGTVYPALAWLATNGYVEAEREAGDLLPGRPLRIRYRITARGVLVT